MKLVITVVLAFIASVYIAWWSFVIVTFWGGFIARSHLRSFAEGLLSIFVCWAGTIAWIDIFNRGLLAGRLSETFHLSHSVYFVLLISLMGGVLGGVSAWSGYCGRKAVFATWKQGPKYAGGVHENRH